jgi:hypothetical protein
LLTEVPEHNVGEPRHGCEVKREFAILKPREHGGKDVRIGKLEARKQNRETEPFIDVNER